MRTEGWPAAVHAVRTLLRPGPARPAADFPTDLDPHARIRRVRVGRRVFVAKSCRTPAAREERRRALHARRRAGAIRVPGLGPLVVVVPQVVTLAGSTAALITPDLGEPLSKRSDAARLVPVNALRATLAALLAAGVEAPGLVPRNSFLIGPALHVIDWEDATFDPVAGPDPVTTAKWDVGWSDVYRTDPGLRYSLAGAATDAVALDGFETTLGHLLEQPTSAPRLRALGVHLTLASELNTPARTRVTPAVLGHLADEVLAPAHSVFHTALTAAVRLRSGEPAYAALVDRLWGRVGSAVESVRRGGSAERDWLRALVSAANAVQPDADRRAPAGLGAVARQYARLGARTGWAAGRRRAELAERLTVAAWQLVAAAFDLRRLQLILRGSLAQGMLTRRSDVDFELSSPEHPDGHRAAEQLVIDILAALGCPAEGSASRPVEVDLRAGPVHRDLHEWMELRRAGSRRHDPGWLGPVLGQVPNGFDLGSRSTYERAGRTLTGKGLWFEARAVLARLTFPTGDVPPVRLPDQVAALSTVVGRRDAERVTALVRTAFDLRERTHVGAGELAALAGRIDAVRQRFGLPGTRP
jgi:hypothetical protein